jgi:DNA replication protein DnaC
MLGGFFSISDCLDVRISFLLFCIINYFLYLCGMKQTMITILGPTASGKTSLAAALASKINSLDAASWGGTTQEEKLLTEIRDLLKEQKG